MLYFYLYYFKINSKFLAVNLWFFILLDIIFVKVYLRLKKLLRNLILDCSIAHQSIFKWSLQTIGVIFCAQILLRILYYQFIFSLLFLVQCKTSSNAGTLGRQMFWLVYFPVGNLVVKDIIILVICFLFWWWFYYICAF